MKNSKLRCLNLVSFNVSAKKRESLPTNKAVANYSIVMNHLMRNDITMLDGLILSVSKSGLLEAKLYG